MRNISKNFAIALSVISKMFCIFAFKMKNTMRIKTFEDIQDIDLELSGLFISRDEAVRWIETVNGGIKDWIGKHKKKHWEVVRIVTADRKILGKRKADRPEYKLPRLDFANVLIKFCPEALREGETASALKASMEHYTVEKTIFKDDYYGKTAFRLLHDFLTEEHEKKDQMRMAMAGFVLKNTVSENGTVTRGVCIGGQDNMLNGVIESRDIAIRDGKAATSTAESKDIINPESIVSMNMWACDPDFLDILEERFIGFLNDPSKDPLKGEFLVPVLIDRLIKENQASVKVLPTSDKWIGITYREDTDAARAEFKRMTAEGIYPAKLWN